MEKDKVEKIADIPPQITFDVEKSFVVAILGNGLFSVGNKLCTTPTQMVNAVKAECGVERKPRKKSDVPKKKR